MGKSLLNSIKKDYSNSEYSIELNKVGRPDFTDNIEAAKRTTGAYTALMAQRRASYLSQKLKNPDGFRFYLKCAWRLSDQYIDWLLELALRKEEPSKYFSCVARRAML